MENEIELYIKNNIKLVSTIIVKNKINADLINDRLLELKGPTSVDLTDPTTWKYYLNLSGEYHSTDTVMKVTSLDTLDEITFNKENLAKHTLTRDSYMFGSRFYYGLVNQYPTQETLIKSILYPCDIQDAINAPDGTILAYQKDLVEEQEETLMWELSEWCKRYQARWKVDAFMHSDTLYPAAQLGIMYLNMVNRLINLRLKRCKTSEAHTFHIKMHLASNNYLSEFLPYYTLKQKLWLYRNISYLRHNTGKVSNFREIVDKMLTDRGIPLSEFSIQHTDVFEKGYNQYRFEKDPINVYINIPDQPFWTLSEINEKVNPILKENTEYNKYTYDTVHKTIQNSPSGVIQTKLLECKLLDYGDSDRHNYPDILSNYWPFMAARGFYTALVNITDPNTSATITLDVENAFIFWFLLGLRKLKFYELTHIPRWLAIRVLIENQPTEEEVLSVSIKNVFKLSNSKEILDHTPMLRLCRTVKQFVDLTKELYNEDKREWVEASNMGDMWRNSSFLNMCNRTKQDVWVDFSSTGKTVEEWMIDNNIQTLDYSESNLDYLINDIFEKCTGYIEDDNINPASIQSALIDTLKRLSSYSIEFIKEINENDILMINWRAVRIAGLDGKPGIPKIKTEVDPETGETKYVTTVDPVTGETIYETEDEDESASGIAVYDDLYTSTNNRCLGTSSIVNDNINLNIVNNNLYANGITQDINLESTSSFTSININIPTMINDIRGGVMINAVDTINAISRVESEAIILNKEK